MSRLIHLLPKPLFFAALGALGCLGGWLAGEPLLKSREAALVVHWHENERTVINLGHDPVILGSSPEAHVYLPREKGFPEVTAVVTFRGGKVEMENKLTNSTHTLQGGNKLQIGTLWIEIQTDVK